MSQAQQRQHGITLQVVPPAPTQANNTRSQRRNAPQQSQTTTTAQLQSPPASQGLTHTQPTASQAPKKGRGCIQWMRETTLTFNLLNVTLAALAFAAAIAYGTKSILQADTANQYAKQSRDIALWQACISNPDNPVRCYPCLTSKPKACTDIHTADCLLKMVYRSHNIKLRLQFRRERQYPNITRIHPWLARILSHTSRAHERDVSNILLQSRRKDDR